ncbi:MULTISPECIES: helix-turn-helix domain-containing protein [unclassified Pseudofrankia]|uniref:helix-turn-helix domain-containing protein n=1 Tax=unclassified Pseudofrankia TaxID=2994372 RepID=UPI0008DA42FC|nr:MULTISPECIES: helix-turn-helix transcriptional regulator [unclassified Pseudofrankia]MDT3443000.1 helix-turn-helix transcriptional regulator [Pseudofrankia sp. BMG5.37]OHV43022.1 transcriptional regulator [Pseudofrankia sp. BMG5.36]
MSHNELGLFLRTHRENISPAEVGLLTGPRRRAPGLRRSEVATLAGVSVEYVIRLEQGRDRRPSPQVLSALADTLRLTPSERIHLHRLTKAADPGFNCRGLGNLSRIVRPTVRALLDRLEPTPAILLDPLTDILAHTAGYERLARPTGLLDAAQPNLARYVFTDSRARATYPDWAHVADEQVAALKQGPFRARPDMAAFADELTVIAGDAFTHRVDTIPSLAKTSGVLRLTHPDAGALRLAYETLELPADDDQRLIVYLPGDAATATALDQLNRDRAQPLRLVLR